MAELAKPAAAIPNLARKQRSLWRDVGRRLVAHAGARIGFALVAVLLIGAALADVLARADPNATFLRETLKPPLVDGHLMGTDDLGRDVFTRLLHGARTSLRVGVVAVGIAVIFGSVVGFTAGFFGRWWDAFVMRVMDIVLSFPTILLAIAIVALRGPGIFNTMLAVGIVAIPVYARISRASAIARGSSCCTPRALQRAGSSSPATATTSAFAKRSTSAAFSSIRASRSCGCPQATRDSTRTSPRCRTRRDRKHSKELGHEIHPAAR